MRLCILTVLFLCLFATVIYAEERTFQEFSFNLLDGWDGSERIGFSTQDRNEYMLILGKKDEAGESYLATINIFFLPNKPNKNAHDSAISLAEHQAEPSEISQEGVFYTFTGDPRDNILKGRAKTYVAANKDNLLIIIIKDPLGNDAQTVFKSMQPISNRAKEILNLQKTN